MPVTNGKRNIIWAVGLLIQELLSEHQIKTAKKHMQQTQAIYQ